MRRYFGTDGIRGIVNEDLTASIAYKCGNALTLMKKYPTIVIGRDTRQSGDILALSLASGVLSGGGNVTDVGILPTAAVAYLAKYFKADYGVVISASHNAPEYNGIKIFSGDGYKLSEEEEEEIESKFNTQNLAMHPKLGKYKQVGYGGEIYIEYLKATCKKDISGLKIILDCSNGAAFSVAPEVFRRLGADVKTYNCESNGIRINVGCGSLHPEMLMEKVIAKGADVGFAFDGDSDRILAVDNKGNIIDGDKIIYALATKMKAEDSLVPSEVVGTHHTNMGIQKALEAKGINLLRSDIGDKYVMDMMRKKGCLLGGEQSGHIILSKMATTGDGILTAIQLAEAIIGGSLTEILKDAKLYPQTNIDLIVKDKIRVMNNEELAEFIDKYRSELHGRGRILVRASGTEPKIRVMVECADGDYAQKTAAAIAMKVKEVGEE